MLSSVASMPSPSQARSGLGGRFGMGKRPSSSAVWTHEALSLHNARPVVSTEARELTHDDDDDESRR